MSELDELEVLSDTSAMEQDEQGPNQLPVDQLRIVFHSAGDGLEIELPADLDYLDYFLRQRLSLPAHDGRRRERPAELQLFDPSRPLIGPTSEALPDLRDELIAGEPDVADGPQPEAVEWDEDTLDAAEEDNITEATPADEGRSSEGAEFSSEMLDTPAEKPTASGGLFDLDEPEASVDMATNEPEPDKQADDEPSIPEESATISRRGLFDEPLEQELSEPDQTRSEEEFDWLR